jgi:hypothetical protein
MSQRRRLAAILAADVAGYSRLMGADKEGTLERLKALRHELFDPKIAEHRGRIVKTTGDGMLVEFASVVDAVRCAVEVQQAMAERNTGVAAGMWLRIDARLPDGSDRQAFLLSWRQTAAHCSVPVELRGVELPVALLDAPSPLVPGNRGAGDGNTRLCTATAAAALKETFGSDGQPAAISTSM